MPGVFPDFSAPVIRNAESDDAQEMVLMRWGMPPPRTGGPPVTNIRNTSSPHWRGWLAPQNRGLFPANVVWFALDDSRPLFTSAGIWTTFNGDCGTKSKPIPRPHLVYGFLTTAPNAVVAIRPKAMPVAENAADSYARSVMKAAELSLTGKREKPINAKPVKKPVKKKTG